MAAYFSGTINALKRGITKMSVDAAIRNIENWEDALQEVEVSGCKAIIRDLGSLKKELQRDEPDGERIRHLMARLGSQTVAISEKAENRYQEKIADLGHCLGESAESSEDEDEQTSSSRSRSLAGNSRSQTSGQSASGQGSGRSSSSRSLDEDEDDDRGSRSSSVSSSSRGGQMHGQGEVKDPEHDGRLKQNRDRGMSKQSDGEDYENGGRSRSGSTSRSSSSRSTSR